MLALHSCQTSFVIKWLLFLSRSLHHCGNQGRLQAEQCWMFLVPWDMVGDGFWTALRLVYLKQVRQLIIQSAWLRKKIVLSSTTLPSPFLVDPLWGEMALSKNSRLLHLMQCSPLFTEVINMLLLHDIYALFRLWEYSKLSSRSCSLDVIPNPCN